MVRGGGNGLIFRGENKKKFIEMHYIYPAIIWYNPNMFSCKLCIIKHRVTHYCYRENLTI